MLRRLLTAGLAALCAGACPGVASAEWLKAESGRFIVYSQGNERSLRDYVQRLETFDWLLRARVGLSQEAAPARKLPVYLVSSWREIAEIFPGAGRDIAGVYSPATEDIFAVAIRGRDDDVMLHEYTHHLMFQLTGVPYPGWLMEGLAEYFATADIDTGQVEIGGYNENRAAWLRQGSWIPLEELLSKRPGEIRRGQNRNTYYPVAWLLTHWFMGDSARRAQLQAYIDDVASGADPVEALPRATGLTLVQLRQALRNYMNGRIPLTRYTSDFPRAEITVTTLPSSADDLLLIGQRLKVGVDDDRRAATAEAVRRRAARHPTDLFAQLQLGHAELHFGDPVAGQAVLTRLLEGEPANVEALQLMASRRLAQAQTVAEGGGDPTSLLRQARGFLSRAYAADDAHYYTFLLIGRSREGAPDYPTENDLATWELAYGLAPQLPAARLGYASALMQVGDFTPAIALLGPLANAPHGGPASEAAQTLLERARAGQPPLSDAEIEAAVEAEETAPPAPVEPAEAGEEGEADSEEAPPA